MQNVYAIRDVKADAYEDVLMLCPTKGLAMRAFIDAVNQPNSRLAKYVDDFHLYEIGTFDPASGTIKGHQLPELVMTARGAVEQGLKDQAQVRKAARKAVKA